MEERRERVIRLSSDSTSFLQNCMVDYFGELATILTIARYCSEQKVSCVLSVSSLNDS